MLQGLRVDTSFVEFQQLREVGVFSYLFYSLLRAILMVRDILRHEWPSFQFQRLGLNDKIPSVVMNSFET